jgi:hypothetical protein
MPYAGGPPLMPYAGGPPLMPYTGGAALMPYIGGPPAALPLVPAPYQAPAAYQAPAGYPGYPAPRVATYDELVQVRSEIRADQEKHRVAQNMVNDRIVYVAQHLGQGLTQAQKHITQGLGVKQTLNFKVPGPNHAHVFQVASFQTAKLATIADVVPPAYVPVTGAGKTAYTKAMQANQGKALAEAMAEEADEDELAAGGAANLIIVDRPIIERQQLWTTVNDKRVLAMACPELKTKIAANIPAGTNIKLLKTSGNLNAAGIRAIQEAREFWGFVELFDNPFDFAGGKAAYEALMAEYGFPSDKGWNGVVDWNLHRDN